MAKKIELTRYQKKQYEQLLRQLKANRDDYERRNDIIPTVSKKEFLQYYEDVRKARRKIQRLERQNAFVSDTGHKFSLSVKNIKTVQELRYREKKIKQQLKPTYRKEAQEESRRRLINNINEIFKGQKGIGKLREFLKNASINDLQKFFNKNPSLQFLKYESDPEKLRARMRMLNIDFDYIMRNFGLAND